MTPILFSRISFCVSLVVLSTVLLLTGCGYKRDISEISRAKGVANKWLEVKQDLFLVDTQSCSKCPEIIPAGKFASLPPSVEVYEKYGNDWSKEKAYGYDMKFEYISRGCLPKIIGIIKQGTKLHVERVEETIFGEGGKGLYVYVRILDSTTPQPLAFLNFPFLVEQTWQWPTTLKINQKYLQTIDEVATDSKEATSHKKSAVATH